MSGIQLVNVVEANGEYTFNVVNADRTIRYDSVIGIKFRTSNCPEFTTPFLFLQGENSELDNEVCVASKYNFFKVVLAINEYNATNNYSTDLSVDFRCDMCNEYHKHPNLNSYENWTRLICTECIDKLKPCTSCGSTRDTVQFLGEYYCPNCICKSVCQHCFKETYIRSKKFTVGEDYHGESKYVNLCEDCYNLPIEMGKEHHYHYVPERFNFWDIDKKGNRVKLLAAPDKKLYMGIEIEAMFKEYSHTNIEIAKVLDVYGKTKESIIYAKHDGTIPDPGSEIVTHPMTLKFIHSLSWEGLFKHVVVPDIKSVGGHVHINKNAFRSPMHTYKFLRFIRTNIQYCEWIGERKLQSDWCKPRSGNGKVVQIAKKFRKNINSDRYEMINFTNHTVELRFFWTPTSANALYKNVEFIDSLYNYTINSPLHFLYDEYEAYVKEHMSQYPYLYNFIHSRTRQQQNFITNNEIYSDVNNRTIRQVPTVCDDIDYDEYDESNDYICCEDCGRELHTDEACTVNDSLYCRDCVEYCDYCEEYTRGSLTEVWESDSSSMFVCRDCRDCGDFIICDECGDWNASRNITITQDGAQAFCSSCISAGETDDYVHCPHCNELIDGEHCENGCLNVEEEEDC